MAWRGVVNNVEFGLVDKAIRFVVGLFANIRPMGLNLHTE